MSLIIGLCTVHWLFKALITQCSSTLYRRYLNVDLSITCISSRSKLVPTSPNFVYWLRSIPCCGNCSFTIKENLF